MPNFVYTRDIPDGPHNPSNDQPPMKINTNSTDSLIEVDHFSFNDNRGGYHKQVNLVNEANPGVPANVGSVLYSTSNEWAFTNSALAPAGVQMTNSAAFPIAANPGRSFLPGGLVIEWGSGTTILPNGTDTQNFIAAYNTVLNVNVTAVSSGNAIINVVVASTTQISVAAKNFTGAAVAVPYFWMVIGKY